jgi:hypothetical protein
MAKKWGALQIWVWSVSNIRIYVEYTKLFLGSKYLIMRSKYFHYRFVQFTVGNIYPENASVLLRFGLHDSKRK